MNKKKPKIIMIQNGPMSADILFGKYFSPDLFNVDVFISWSPTNRQTKEDLIQYFKQYNGIILSGSPSMITDRHAWTCNLSLALKEIILEQKIFILGICFGHQLICDMFGCKIGWIPSLLWQLGLTNISLTNESKNDPLFSTIDQTNMEVITNHKQIVLDINEINCNLFTLLASTSFNKYYAFRIGNKVWTTQFHPEYTIDLIKTIIKNNTSEILDADKRLEEVSKYNGVGEMIINNFSTLLLSKGS
ncbi:MAG: glutamine amidotransferase [Terrestrivirus sp.]|uniref:Glutamine amidotransferase n=1 Tax=Terrestrivirus sp. TaxID=2487775 RepID=A0A3G4ZQJ6_9VIRU|nr:MAG: glutamine amidotransferase [Terrestrivirus sp.]